MLILVAIALLFVLPAPWNVVAFLVLVPLWIAELLGWNQTVKYQRRVVGAETMIGRDAVVVAACLPAGQIQFDGEIWEARCDAGAAVGQSVRVVGREQLTLIVSPLSRDRGTTVVPVP